MHRLPAFKPDQSLCVTKQGTVHTHAGQMLQVYAIHMLRSSHRSLRQTCENSMFGGSNTRKGTLCLTSMSVSTSRSGPDPWGLCSKGPCPSLLSELEATLHQQACLDDCHVVYVNVCTLLTLTPCSHKGGHGASTPDNMTCCGMQEQSTIQAPLVCCALHIA